MAFWTAARTEPRREHVARHFLTLTGYWVYQPQIQERRGPGRVWTASLLFESYVLVLVPDDGRWWSIRRTIGIVSLIMSGQTPARIPDSVIAEIRGRERGGFVQLPGWLAST
jgi:transcriptional antiterminator RfaH